MKRTVVDITEQMHSDLALLAKIAGTTIRKEVELALSVHLRDRMSEPQIKDAFAKMQERWISAKEGSF